MTGKPIFLLHFIISCYPTLNYVFGLGIKNILLCIFTIWKHVQFILNNLISPKNTVIFLNNFFIILIYLKSIALITCVKDWLQNGERVKRHANKLRPTRFFWIINYFLSNITTFNDAICKQTYPPILWKQKKVYELQHYFSGNWREVEKSGSS